MSELKSKAVLMRFSAGLPGEARQDRKLTEKVKATEGLGDHAGKWQQNLYPPAALDAIKSKENEARQYHNSMTLPFDNGIGILPAPLIDEYRDQMGKFRSEILYLADTTFLADPQSLIDWARSAHNGTFNPKNYPGCTMAADGSVTFDPDVFRASMREKFYLRCDPLPVPDSTHFESTVKSLLGTDADGVNDRIRDAAIEGQKELLGRVLTPVKKMFETLSKDKPRIYETLLGNIKDICRLAPALNLADDPRLNELVREVSSMADQFSTEGLRDSDATKAQARAAAEAVMKRLEGYAL